MAEIATYRCDNYRCRLTVRLCKDFPVWRSDAPLEGRSIVPSPSHRPYVERYRSEIYCHHCRRVIADARDAACGSCGNADLRNDQTGQSCVQCYTGVFQMIDLTVR